MPSRAEVGRNIWLALACGVACAALQAWSGSGRGPNWLSEEHYLDWLFTARELNSAGADEPIMVVGFDGNTFQALGTAWDQFTPKMTQLVKILHDGGARVIGFDTGLSFMGSTEEARAFLSATRDAGNVVLASELADPRKPPAVVSRPVRDTLDRIPVVTGFANFLDPGSPRAREASYRENRSGCVRVASLVSLNRNQVLHSFAMTIAQRALELPDSAIRCSDRSVVLGTRSLPLESGLLRIDYPGRQYYQRIPLENLLSGRTPGRIFAGKTVLVGSVDERLGDQHVTPYGSTHGIYLQAAAVHTLLSGTPLGTMPSPLRALLTVFVSLLAGFCFRKFRGAWAMAAVAVALVFVQMAAFILFHLNTWFPALYPTVGLVGTSFLLWGLAGESRHASARMATVVSPSRSGGPLGTAESGHSNPSIMLEEDMVLAMARQALEGKYLNLTILGRGGMGVVFRAHDPVRGADVAVKLLSPLMADRPDLTKRFMREVSALGQLDHPAIVRILDVGPDGPAPYYAMELISGAHLREITDADGPLSIERARVLFRDLWGALEHIHSHGIIHRDIKPENLIVTESDQLKVLDFGLAHLPEASVLTQEGQLMGTVRYMSPEQLGGKELTPASDVFSAALVIYEALTGYLPFPKAGILLRHDGTYTPLAEARPGAPPGLSELLSQCLISNHANALRTGADVLAVWDKAFTN